MAAVGAQDRLDIVQMMRGLAALGVVLWHASVFLGPYGQGIGGILFSSAAPFGVDLFFLISGFIMVYSTSGEGPADSLPFLIKRFARIWPLYLAASLGILFLQWGAADQTLSRFVYSILFIPMAGPNVPAFAWPTLNVGWTLNYEMYFYAIFGASLLFGRHRWTAFFTWIVATLVVVPYMMGTLTLNPLSTTGFEITFFNLATNPLVWLFVEGVVIGLIYCSSFQPNERLTRILLWASLAFMAWQYTSQFRNGHGVLYAGLSVAPVMFFAVLRAKTATIRIWSPLVSLGGISYSLYLTHPLVLGGYYFLRSRFGLPDPTGGFAHVFAVAALSIALAAITHPLIEVRISNLLRAAFMRLAGAPRLDRIPAATPAPAE